MKKVIVTTTINPPTEALEKFEAMKDWELVVIGDLKTPPDYRLGRAIYVSPQEQEAYDPALSEAIGWNCIQRRNFGLLWAHDLKADLVAVVDDDNIPYDHWGKNLFVGKKTPVNYYTIEDLAFDPVGATNHPHLWHRGFPLQWLSRREYPEPSRREITPDVQADFWDGDPDIDAFCRMEHAPECKFDARYFPMAANKMGPFNSQNTFLTGAMLKDYFLFPGVGRMDDIWASYYVQAKGYQAIWGAASVYQARNVHDLTKDMKAEWLGYQHNHELVRDLTADPERILSYLPETAQRAFALYRKHFAPE